MRPLRALSLCFFSIFVMGVQIHSAACEESRLQIVDYEPGAIQTLYGCPGFETANKEVDRLIQTVLFKGADPQEALDAMADELQQGLK